MGILFVLALLLAWPTFGLSLVAWLILAFFRSKNNVKKSDQRKVMMDVLSPLFGEKYAEFYEALDVPYNFPSQPSNDEAHKCGRHIANYIAHNPTEAALFTEGLKLWTFKGSNSLCDPVEAVECELGHDAKGNIHLVAYRAIEALMTQNNLPCFHHVDLSTIKQYIDAIEDRSHLYA